MTAHQAHLIQAARDGLFIVAVGVNGTGKSTYVKKFLPFNKRNLIVPANASDSAKAWGHVPALDVDRILKNVTGLGPFDWELLDLKANREKKTKLALYFHSRIWPQLRGNVKIEIPHRRKALFDIIIHDELGFTKGGLIFDDFKNYIPAYNPPENVVRWLSDRRHRELDIFLCTHSPNKIPAAFFDNGPQIVLFKTTRNFSSADQKITADVFAELIQAQERLNKLPLPPKGNGPVIGPYEIIKVPEAK